MRSISKEVCPVLKADGTNINIGINPFENGDILIPDSDSNDSKFH
jgi:hypothetical protein